MKDLGKFLVLERAEDLNNNVIYDKEYRTRIDRIGVIHHNGDKQNYPQYYKYIESWDTRCCGDFIRCSREEIIEHYEKKIKEIKEIIENL